MIVLIIPITLLEKYEARNGAKQLTLTQFYCYYREDYKIKETESGGLHRRNFYHEELPLFVYSGPTKYKLRHKESFWRTFNQSELNGEKFYFQQIVIKLPIYNTTFEKLKGEHRTWRGKIYTYIFIT